MLNRTDSDFERKATFDILRRFCFISLFIPFFVTLIVWTYFNFSNIPLNRSAWKTIVLCVWLGTLAVLFKEAIAVGTKRRFRRPWQRSLDPDDHPTNKRNPQRLSRWENRNSQRLIKDFVKLSIVLPILSLGFSVSYFKLVGRTLEAADWKTMIFIVWIGVLLSLVRLAITAARKSVVYSN